ncbi:type II toxin-antitoxin system HipA family toxin [Mycetocola reblochoni]|uniref:HipA protein n=2 Tax=Mycetocola reblochoni TaxID=331618 RepID=A0A1R4I877_9MICO|nr:type II toxin-antitoxin system HipA family toxin [Mycetocola reblochoni]SJN15824.1 HipA protein [Mycetocola reblochoni REB411]
MPEPIEVTTVIAGRDVLAGRIHRTRATGSFTYDDDYLRNRAAFALAPALGLHRGAFPLSVANPFSDSAPDTWGRKVLNRAAGRTLDEISLLLGVSDESRQGATRFWTDGVARADEHGVPPEAELSELLRVADQVERNERDIDNVAVRRLFRATGSLGGARPKANVRLGTELWLAKFPKPQGDHWNKMAWEAAMLELMGRVGITVPTHTTTQITVDGEQRTVLLLKRFDRSDTGTRIPYISAMTALESADGDGGDWVDLVDVARLNGADTRELWRRALFGAAVGNLDDHLRNHGFLRRGNDWQLSPAFDVNPEPRGDGDEHQLALGGESTVTVEALRQRDALQLFGVRVAEADSYAGEVRSALADAGTRAAANGADPRSVAVMESRIASAMEAL